MKRMREIFFGGGAGVGGGDDCSRLERGKKQALNGYQHDASFH